MQTFREYSENAKSIIATINNRLKDIAIHDDKYTGLKASRVILFEVCNDAAMEVVNKLVNAFK